ncbi:NHLP bacteriocin export ABC transporter permease/ATPase subunit [Bacillus sp. Marseille-P3661]|uniref:NHLP bacteriocin export ABC transporter permease/ATPase subunit n=1 Tax=Bacillus sp. Marseille-P3661 TaxID=1936234 RepID=UPI000C845F11|nr:NHLP bacteriocin export ABC transporter permease/ATPase subunit [Bacillus sp. Marseille-P3661]
MIENALAQFASVEESDQAWLLINETNYFYYVASGTVDLYTVPIQDNGAIAGGRNFLLCVEEKGLIFSLPSKSGVAMLADIPSHTRLWRIPVRKALEVLATSAEYHKAWGEKIDEWLLLLGEVIAPSPPLPGCETINESGDTVVIQNTSFTPESGVLWIESLNKPIMPWNMGSLPRVNAGAKIPISRASWIAAAAGSVLKAYKSDKLFITGNWLKDLMDYHYLVATVLLQRAKNNEFEEKAALQARIQQNRNLMEQAVSSLKQVTEMNRFGEKDYYDNVDPLIACIRRVGNCIGINIRQPKSLSDGKRLTPEQIFQESGVAFRRVALRGDWYRQDHGPLLGFLVDGTPISLIPKMVGGYEVWVEAETEDPIMVNKEIAELFQPFAYELYRPLPNRTLKLRDLANLALSKRLKKDLTLGIGIGFIVGLLGLSFPAATGILIDTLLTDLDNQQFVQMFIMLTAIAFAVFGFTITQSCMWLRIFTTWDASLQSAVWHRLLQMPLTFFREFSAGDLAVRVSGVNTFFRVLSNWVISGMASTLFAILQTGLLFLYIPKLAWLAIGLVCIYVFAFIGISFPLIRLTEKKTELEGSVNGLLVQLFGGIAKFRVADAESRAFHQWSRRFGLQRAYAFKLRSVQNILLIINSGYLVTASLLLFWLAGGSNSGMTSGTFAAFYAAFGTLIGSVIGLCSSTISLFELIPLYKRIKPLLLTQPETSDSNGDPGLLLGSIELNHVSFRYDPDGPLVLNDISLHIQAGEYVAIVGSSGSGKSTLLRLLIGFDIPQSGSIYFDGKDLNGLQLSAVRKQCGVVLQNGTLWAGDIADNIIGQNGGLSLEDAWDAAQLVGLDEDISKLPMGMHTVLSDGSGFLSGGQVQRILIARAIVHNPRILFLDEATSALDQITQEKITTTLDRMNVTRIVIAHRLSTIRHADRIIVLESGRIVEEGSYDELIHLGGHFSKMAARQVM